MQGRQMPAAATTALLRVAAAAAVVAPSCGAARTKRGASELGNTKGFRASNYGSFPAEDPGRRYTTRVGTAGLGKRDQSASACGAVRGLVLSNFSALGQKVKKENVTTFLA